MFRTINIRHYLAFMESRGFAAADVLADSQIDADRLKSVGTLIEFAQCQTVIANMMRLTANQGIGLEVGSHWELSDLGIVGHAMMSSKTARDAVQLWMRYSNSLVGTLISLSLDEPHFGGWSLTISESRPLGFVYNFCVEELLIIIIRLGSALTQQNVVPRSLELSYPAPTHQQMYAHYLRCSPQFNSRRTRVTFDSPELGSGLRGADEEFNAICLQHCSQIMRQIASESPLASRIRSLLLSRLEGVPALEQLASQLGMSPRSLRRHLHDEGYAYKDLIRQFRIELAQEYLKTSRMTAKQTAYLLGFKDTNAFRRAFKSWTGKTIHEFRDEADAETRRKPRAEKSAMADQYNRENTPPPAAGDLGGRHQKE